MTARNKCDGISSLIGNETACLKCDFKISQENWHGIDCVGLTVNMLNCLKILKDVFKFRIIYWILFNIRGPNSQWTGATLHVAYPILSIPWLLESGHQQVWYWPNKSEYSVRSIRVNSLRLRNAYMGPSTRTLLVRCQAIIWTDASWSLIAPYWSDISEIWIKTEQLSHDKINLQMLSGKWWPFLLASMRYILVSLEKAYQLPVLLQGQWMMEIASIFLFPQNNLSHNELTHWGWVMHICIGYLAITDSDNGLLPGQQQAIIWNNAGILLIGPRGTKFNEIFIKMQQFL